MKYVVKYKLHNGKVPYFIEDGGYYVKDNVYIGVTRDDSECHVPRFVIDGGELKSVTEQELHDFINNELVSDKIKDKTKEADKFFKDKKLKEKN